MGWDTQGLIPRRASIRVALAAALQLDVHLGDARLLAGSAMSPCRPPCCSTSIRRAALRRTPPCCGGAASRSRYRSALMRRRFLAGVLSDSVEAAPEACIQQRRNQL